MADLDFKLIIDAVTEGFDSAQKKVDGLFGSIESNSKKLESVGKNLSLALTAPIAAFAAFSISAFREQEKNITKFTDSFEKQGGRIGFTFDELSKKADDFSKTSIFQDDDILGGVTSQLLNFDIQNKEIFDSAQKVILDFASKTGDDLNTATLAIGKALQNPAEGLALLRRQGVAVTDSQVEFITQLDKTGKSAEAQAEIIKLLSSQYGGFAKELANTDTGKLDILNNSFKKIKEDFGEALLKALRPLITFFTDLLNAIDKLNPSTKEFIAVTALIVAAIPPAVAALGTLTAAFALLEIPLLAIAGPVGLFVGLAGALVVASEKFGSLGNAINNFMLEVNKQFLNFFENINKLLQFANLGFLSPIINGITGVLKGNIDQLNGQIDAFILESQKKIDKSPLGGNPKPNPNPNPKKLTPEQMKAIEDEAKARAAFLKQADDEARAAFDKQNQGPGFLEGSFNFPAKLDNLGGLVKKAAGDVSEVKNELIELGATEAILSDSFATFFEDMAFGAKSAGQAIKDLGKTILQSLFSTAIRQALNSVFANIFANGKDPLTSTTTIGKKAAGGQIHGPGTGTSDSILARLSNGEFVMRAASVQKYGTDFFHALNKGLVPKFNIGGKVSKIKQNLSGIPRLATGGLVSQQSPVNVQVINNSSQPVQAKTNRIIDPSGTVIQIVLEDLKNNGPISQQFQGAFGVSR